MADKKKISMESLSEYASEWWDTIEESDREMAILEMYMSRRGLKWKDVEDD